jgi:threonyl-tRNA synthetase
MAYTVDPGEGVFYGPKIDIKIKDCLDRAWQCSTIQVDFHNPTRFDLGYVAEDGKAHQPVMIHRALMGSLERFFGVLIEHYAGAFPVWLAPVQATIIPIADRHVEFARKVQAQLKESGIRVEVDDSTNRMQNKIREAQNQKIPYMLVIGDKEQQVNAVNVRLRSGEQLGAKPVAEVIALIKDAVAKKA